MKKTIMRVLSLVLVLSLLAGFMVMPVTVSAAQHEHSQVELPFEQVENATESSGLVSSAVEEAADEPLFEDTDIVRVSIILEQQPTIHAGFSTLDISDNAQAMAYRDKLRDQQVEITAKIENALHGQVDVAWNLTLAVNLISANVLYGQIDTIRGVDGVQDVVIENRYSPAVVDEDMTADPNMATSSEQIGSGIAWANGYTGAGSRIAIIDTGVDTDHQSFAESGYQYSLAYRAGLSSMTIEEYTESLDLLDVEEITSVLPQLNRQGLDPEALYVSSKIPFAYNYIDADYDVTHDNDWQYEHGSHVTGIAAANAYIKDENGNFVRALDTVKVQGVAPDAQIITMKVFGKNGGAYESDYMAAIEDAIILGCDSVNLSLGSTNHGLSYNDYYTEMLDNLQKTDIVLVTSASNASHYATYDYNIGYLYADEVNFHTGGAPGTYFNTLAVSSVNNIGGSGLYIEVGGEMIFYYEYFPEYYGMEKFKTLAGEREYVFVDGHALRDEVYALGREVLEGKIFICSRGSNSFYQKANYAVENGAAATIIYNNQAGSIGLQMNGYQYPNPAVSITQEEGALIKANSTPVTDENGSILYYTGTMTVGSNPGSVISDSEYTEFSDFSSWGIPGSLILKPEISAPGGNIYSVYGSTPDGGGSDQYENMSGTSMAAPQITGMVAVLGQYIEENGLHEKTGLSSRQLAHSLLMSTAVPGFEEASGGNYWSILLQGSGVANLGHAVNANSYIVMGEDATDFAADGKVKAELGDDPEKTGSYTFSFSIHDLTGSGSVYTLSADFFTQDVFEHDGQMYLDTMTTSLPMNVRFNVDGKLLIPVSSLNCDLNADGVTTADDAQVILNYAAGTMTKIDPIADLDSDGRVTTYDAYILLDNLETASFTVPVDGKVDVTVTAQITESAKAYLDANYPAGAYVEGFVYANPCATEEGAVEDVVHSIPVIGFYGSWTDPSMYEGLRFVDNYYGDLRTPHTPYTETNGMILKYYKDPTAYWFTGNPSIVEDVYPAERTAMNSKTTIYQYQLTLTRNASAIAFLAVDENGEVVYISEVTNNVYSPYYDQSWGLWVDVGLTFNVGIRPAIMGLKEGDRFTFMAVAIPEYYRDGDPLTGDDIVRLYNEGALGEGAFLSDSFVVDDTAPQVHTIARDLLTDNLIVSATDNQYIAGIMVTDLDGNVLAKTAPAQSTANEKVTVEFDLSFVEKLGKVKVIVTDYAYNRSTYTVQAGDDHSDPYANRMYAFTTGSQLGVSNRWMEIDRERLSYCNVQFSSGMTNLDTMDMTVVAAEYLEGYVFMFDTDGVMYVAEHPNFDEYLAVGPTGIDEIYDVAFNYADNKLYALTEENEIYSIDIASGKATYEYRVFIYSPRDDETESEYLRTLAIDDEGNFYSVSARGTNNTYLYRWDNSMVNEKGRVSNLAPINNTRNGRVGYASQDKLQSMAWDHTTGTLYWANATDWYNRYLLKFDLTTGKAFPCNQNGNQWGDTTYDAKPYESLYAMYIVPGSAESESRLPSAEQATGITISSTSKNVLCGAMFRLNASVTPWNLEDKGVIWTSSDESVVTVDAEGNVHAVGVGSAVVTVTAASNTTMSAECTITVEPMVEVEFSSVVHNSDGVVNIAEFSSNSPEAWTSVGTTEVNIQSGTLMGDELIVHDGKHMYSVDPESFLATDLGPISSTWRWSDATLLPGQEDMFVTDLMASICYNGKYVALIDPTTGSLSYLDMSAAFAEEDPMAAIAYKGSGIHDNGIYPAQYLYILTESGNLYILEFWSFADAGIMVENEQIGRVNLELTDVSYLTTGQYASMYYDEATGYLFLTASLSGNESQLYAIDPVTFDLLQLGTFGAGSYPVVSLYQFERITELTVLLDSSEERIYVGNSVQLSATVKPWYMENGVVWSSGDESIATVSEDGLVTGVGEGDVTITATSIDVDENGDPATAQCVVHVKSTAAVASDLHAFVERTDGSYEWVTFNGSDIKTLTTQHISTERVIEGTGLKGKIYTETDAGLRIIDPATYEASDAVQDARNFTFLDMASAPGIVYDGAYIPGIGMTKAVIFDNIFYVSSDGTMGIFVDFESGTMMTDWEGWWPFFENDIAACCCVGKTTLNGAPAMAFHIIDVKGLVYSFVASPTVWNEDGVATSYTGTIPSIIGDTDLTFAEREAVTMTYLDNGISRGYIIADSANDEVNLYFTDITGTEYSTDWIGSIPNITSLTALFTNDELTREPETLEGSDSTGNEAFAYRDGTATTLSSKFHVSQDYREPILSSTEPGCEANASTGYTNVSANVPAERIAAHRSSGSNVSDGKVSIVLTEQIDTCNGLITVRYDPAVLTYADTASNAMLSAVNVNEEAGTVTFAYASANVIAAEDVLATVNFTYDAGYINTEVTICTAERNQELAVAEDAEVVSLVHEVGGHDYEITETVAATCTEAGYAVYTCIKCGDSYREELAALGHSYESTVIEPTCTEVGYTVYTCANCGDSYREELAALGHSYEAVITEPTCTTGGFTTYTCKLCGDSHTVDFTDPDCASAHFIDVAAESWYHEAVDYVVETGLMNGVSETAFHPEGVMNRAQMVTVLYRMAGSPDVGEGASFTDVPADSFYADAVSWAVANGITNGVSENAFAPNGSVTREQMVVFLYRYHKLSGADLTTSGDLRAYTDAAEVSVWAVDAMIWAVENGIISGITPDTLAPAATTNRAQIATVLMNYSA